VLTQLQLAARSESVDCDPHDPYEPAVRSIEKPRCSELARLSSATAVGPLRLGMTSDAAVKLLASLPSLPIKSPATSFAIFATAVCSVSAFK
jgi:hypothetical protein